MGDDNAMAIFTPRGLKIRLPIDYSFALMARLYPQVSAFRILKTCEGIESIPSVLAFSAAMVCFIGHFAPYVAGIAIFCAYIVGSALTQRGLFILPGLVAVSTLFSYLAGYGLFTGAVLVTGYLTLGWQGVLAYAVARVAAFVCGQVIEFADTRRAYREAGIARRYALTASEKHFINAYRLHARRSGKTTDVAVREDEQEQENWLPAFEDLAAKWPEVVQRFTLD
jgi:hypothetical protein